MSRKNGRCSEAEFQRRKKQFDRLNEEMYATTPEAKEYLSLKRARLANPIHCKNTLAEIEFLKSLEESDANPPAPVPAPCGECGTEPARP